MSWTRRISAVVVQLRTSIIFTLLGTLLLPAAADAQLSFRNATQTNLIGAIDSESWGLSIGDLEGDYWPDIFLTNHRNRPSLFQYDGNGNFINNILQRDPDRSWLGERYDDTHGAAWSDFDADGDDDLVVGTNAAAWHFFMMSNRGSLKDEARLRLRQDISSSYSMWFDINRDGLTDLFQGRDKLDLSVYFRQRPNTGNFDAARDRPGCDGDWAYLSDVTDDGIADFICAREGEFPIGSFDTSAGYFRDITRTMPTASAVVDSTAADFNNDLRPDLFLLRGALSASHAALHNSRLIEISSDTGPGEVVEFSFTGGASLRLNSWSPPAVRQSRVVSGSTTIGGFRLTYQPANNQWNVRRTSTQWEYAYLQIRSTADMRNLRTLRVSARDASLTPQLFRRQNGAWQNRTDASGMRIPLDCKSVVAADFDNDMDQDLFMACGKGARNTPNRLFRNNGYGYFSEVPLAAGAMGVVGAPFADGVGSGESVASGDFNNDGFIDLFVLNGNNSQPVRGRYGPPELMLNSSRSSGNSNHWIELHLIGTTSAADAAGARVVARANNVSQLREVGANYHRWSQNDDRVHFGLAGNRFVDLTITWPSGRVESFNRVAADRLYSVRENQGITPIMPSSPAPFPTPVAGNECGAPAFFPDMDSGLFLFKNCVNGRWSIRASAARNESYRYQAAIGSNLPVTINSRLSLESNDFVNSNSARSIGFSLNAANANQDGFEFTLTGGSSTCMRSVGAANPRQRVMLGRNHLPITLPFNLNTLRPCGGASSSTLSVGDARVNESGIAANFVVTLSPAEPSRPVTVIASGRRLSATPGIDYYGFSETLTFLPGETRKNVRVRILDDSIREGDEKLGIRLLDATNAVIGDELAEMVIVDNDGPTNQDTITVNNVVIGEDIGIAYFALIRSPANSPNRASVQIMSSQTGTATPGMDYYGLFNNVTFNPGVNRINIPVTIIEDSIREGDETFGVRLNNAVNVSIQDGTGVMRIIDND